MDEKNDKNKKEEETGKSQQGEQAVLPKSVTVIKVSNCKGGRIPLLRFNGGLQVRGK